MMNFEQAKQIVLDHLESMESSVGEKLSLMCGKTIEKPFGWVFFYNTARYVETGDSVYMLAGNSPLIVDRDDGELHETGTARPIEEYIAAYEEKKKSP